jgi:glycosyltransferase involved in cell wall biosynthesis
VTIPVFVLPLGLDLKDFIQFPLKNAKNFPLTFANFGQCSSRKNQLTIVRAFAKAFGNNPAVKLILGWRVFFGNSYRNAVINEVKKLGLQNVEIQERSLSHEDYIKRLRTIDCCAYLSKGEGFSIQPREVMALGIPTIVSNSTAQKTICASGLVRSVPANILVSTDYISFSGIFGHFEDCTIDDAASAMIDVYEHYDTYLQKSLAARQWACRYNYPNLRRFYLSVIQPKNIYYGETNKITKHGIITSSKQLFEKYIHLFPDLQKDSVETSSKESTNFFV